jgi:GNAT superfamily N-acetyltransferase
VILRRATTDDAAAIGRLHHHTMRTSLPFLPDLHPVEDVIAFIGREILPRNEVWVAESDHRVAGYVAFAPGWINQLYVHPEAQGRQIGPRLLDKALADGQPRQLWTFQRNARARAFYEARGFVAVELTDGAGNMEQEPDVRYAWQP